MPPAPSPCHHCEHRHTTSTVVTTISTRSRTVASTAPFPQQGRTSRLQLPPFLPGWSDPHPWLQLKGEEGDGVQATQLGGNAGIGSGFLMSPAMEPQTGHQPLPSSLSYPGLWAAGRSRRPGPRWAGRRGTQEGLATRPQLEGQAALPGMVPRSMGPGSSTAGARGPQRSHVTHSPRKGCAHPALATQGLLGRGSLKLPASHV